MFQILAGRIPVRVDDDGAGLVGLHAPPVTRVEPDAGQGQHVVLLRFEQFPHRNAMPVMVRPGDAFARVQPHAGQRPEALGRRHRHHQVAPREADRVFHAALLMAGIRVAEPGLESESAQESGRYPCRATLCLFTPRVRLNNMPNEPSANGQLIRGTDRY